MVFKILIVFFLKLNLAFSNIIYDKNEITITDIEINNYVKLYKNNYNKILSKNKAVKNIVLIKQTINILLKENPEYISKLDQKIKLEFGEKIFKNEILINFLRFQNIRNEFISEYFKNEFTLEDLQLVLTNLKELKYPLSINECLTIDAVQNLNRNEQFISNFYKNLKNNQKDFKVNINNIIYDVCIDNELFENLESTIINYIENKTTDNFNKFIYRKFN
jgi:hypothetical protein